MFGGMYFGGGYFGGYTSSAFGFLRILRGTLKFRNGVRYLRRVRT